jgi:hypothetical protein
LCQSASRVKLIRGLSSTSKVEDLWISRLGTAYNSPTLFSLIVVTLCVMQNSSHLISPIKLESVCRTGVIWRTPSAPIRIIFCVVLK